ncbi:MAG: hypothetical protein KJ915_13775 [Candidatus Omnitrophica bacterium]|nr:hypothetical protein [Candidatus Omnitrophota bacterium]
MKFIIEEKIRFRVRYVAPIVIMPREVIIAVCIETRGFFSLNALIIWGRSA